MIPSWFLILALVLVVTAIRRAGRGGRDRLRRRQCRECGGVFPAQAKFCGQCGRVFADRHGGRKHRRRNRALRLATARRG